MTILRTSLASLLLPAILVLGAPLARSQDVPSAADKAVKLAQKSDDKDERDKDRKGRRESDGEGRKKDSSGREGADAGRDRKREEAKPEKDRAQQKRHAERPRRDAGQERKDGPRTMQDAVRERALELRAKEQERKQKKEEQQARERELKQRQDAERARQDAARQKQLQEQQARERDLKQKQEAERARQDAVRQKQLQEQQAREKDLRQKQDGPRDKAGRDRDPRDQRREADRDRRDRREPGKFDRARSDQEFERARKEAEQKGGKGPAEAWRPQAAKKFEELRKGRKTREVGSRDIITEPDKRIIVRDEKRTIIRHDETARLTRKGREVRRERRKDGTWLVVTAGLAGALIHSIMDDDGRVVRRSRRDRDGREHVLFDDRRSYRRGGYGPDYRPVYIDLPPPVVRIPRERYIVDYDRASFDDIYEALNAPPVETLDRGYSLDEIRYNYSILERMRRVDLDAINFAFGSWEVGEDQYPKLERIARAIHRVLDRSPNEVFLIEGHTDAVGSDIDNLSLSDRRAEMVAAILTDTFDVPPENLTTQGYGESYLKELTEGPSRINRRVAVRRITPLLSRDGWDDPA